MDKYLKHIGPIGGIVIVTVAVAAFILGRTTVSPNISDADSEEVPGTPTDSGDSAAGVNTRTVQTVLATEPTLSRFAALFNSSSSKGQLSASGKYTIFAPTNGAFALANPTTVGGLSGTRLNDFVKNHIVAKNISVTAIETGFAKSLLGNDLQIDKRDQDDAVLVNSGFVIRTYVTGNGTVYVISAVLLPPQANQQR